MAVTFGVFVLSSPAVTNRMTPVALPDHVSRGGTSRDELRGDQGGERQQELLKGEFQGV